MTRVFAGFKDGSIVRCCHLFLCNFEIRPELGKNKKVYEDLLNFGHLVIQILNEPLTMKPKFNSAADFFQKESSKEAQYFVSMNMDISEQVMKYLKEKGWTQKDFAKALGKTESEVSKWLGGMHNLTLKSIAKMAAVLEKDILITPCEAKARYQSVKYVTLAVYGGINKDIDRQQEGGRISEGGGVMRSAAYKHTVRRGDAQKWDEAKH